MKSLKVMMGLVPLPFTDLGCPSWPLMEVIVETATRCARHINYNLKLVWVLILIFSYYPNDRPTMSEILSLMKNPCSNALRSVIPINSTNVRITIM